MDDSKVADSQWLQQTCHLLRTQGHHEASEHLARTTVHLDPNTEPWTIAGHTVMAHRAVLTADVHTLARLRSDHTMREQIRSALATTFEASDRVLRDLAMCLDQKRSSAHPYRDSSQGQVDLPASDDVLRAAVAYARELSDEVCAALLAQSVLSLTCRRGAAADRPGALRVEVQLSLEDAAKVQKDTSIVARMRRALQSVLEANGTWVVEVVVGAASEACDSAVSWRGLSVLQQLLGAEGVGSVVMSRTDTSARLVVCLGDALGIVDVGECQAPDRIVRIAVERDGSDPAGQARRIRDTLRDATGKRSG